MVVKVNEIGLWEELGVTAKSPRWAIAYKYPAHQATTVVNEIRAQVGRTGTLTPVADLGARGRGRRNRQPRHAAQHG